MKTGDLVFNETRGFGTITKLDGDGGRLSLCTVRFYKGPSRSIMALSLLPVSADFVEWCGKGAGAAAPLNSSVSNISYLDDPFLLEGTVTEGEKACTVEVHRTSGGYAAFCSCSSGRNCAHTEAFVNYLSGVFAALSADESPDILPDSRAGALPDSVWRPGCVASPRRNSDTGFSASSSSETDELDDLAKDINVNAPELYLTCRSISRSLAADCRESRMSAWLGRFMGGYMYTPREKEAVLTALYFNADTRETFCDLAFSRRTVFSSSLAHTVKSCSATVESEGETGAEPRCALYHFYNGSPREAVRCILEGREVTLQLAEVLTTLLREEAGDKELLSLCSEYCAAHGEGPRGTYGRPLSYTDPILQLLTQEQRLEIYARPGSRIRVFNEDIDALSPSLLLDCAEAGRITDDGRLIAALFGIAPEYARRTASVLYTLASRGLSEEDRAALLSVASRLPASGSLVFCLRAVSDIYFEYDITSVTTSAERAAVAPEELYTYFTPQLTFTEDRQAAAAVFSLRAPNGAGDVLSVRRNAAGERTVTVNLLDGRLNSPLADRLADDMLALHGEEIARGIDDLNRTIMLRSRRQETEQLNRSLDRWLPVLSSQTVTMSESALAAIDFDFLTSEDEAGEFFVEFRVGQGRKYVVKDAAAFVEAFISHDTVKYGKTFEFTHTLDNLEPVSRAAMEILLTAVSGYSVPRTAGKKSFCINAHVLCALFSCLRGREITFNDTPYVLTLEPKTVRLGIGEDLRLSNSLNCPPECLVDAVETMYVLDPAASRIDFLQADARRRALALFAAENDGVCVDLAFERFRDEVYSRFYRDIDLHPSLLERFRLSDVEISARFDWEEGTIPVTLSLSREGSPVELSGLTLPLDKTRYANCIAYLAQLGFVDGVLTDEAEILRFLSMDLTELKEHCSVYLSESLASKKLSSFRRQTISIHYENGIAGAFLEPSEYSDAELESIIRAVRKKKKYVLLSGDRILDLTGDDALDFEAAVTDLDLDAKNLSAPQRVTTVQAVKAMAHESQCRADTFLLKMVEDIREFKSSSAPVPAVSAELRPYQEEGFRWLRVLSDYRMGGILADDMGLGKTLQVITLLKSDTAPGPNLIVCPKSLVFNWKNEFTRFDPDAEVREIYGSADRRRDTVAMIDPDEKVTYITSYDSLRNDLEFYTASFNFLILDEAQYIKNAGALKSVSVKSLKAEHRFALTGTPIENSVLDLWSIFDFIMPGYLDDLPHFRDAYSNSEDYTALIARRVAPFILRRTKKDVLSDLPEKFERIISVEMTPEQRKLYDAYRKTANEAMQADKKAFQLLPYLTRLRQICDDPSMFVEDYSGGSGKLDALMSLLQEYIAAGHRLLVFSQFVKCLEELEARLQGAGIAYYMITGDVPAAERIELMNDFNATDRVPVFLISLKAGGTGLNLTGADTVIHLDPWWNVAAENQASDRAHRIGQQRTVEVIRLICENTVEQKVIELQNIKKDVIESLISDTDSSVTSITLSDISFLLQ